MKKQYAFLEIEILDGAGDVICGLSGEPDYGTDGTDDWGGDIWGAPTNITIYKGF